MVCRHCGKKISLLKRLSDAEFCSAAHRDAFLQQEQEAAMARLLQHGARLGHPAEPAAPPAKPKQKGKKKAGKDEIPAPLAGLLPETSRRPKVRRKTVSLASMHAWEMLQELPESPLAILARRLEVAERIPIEAHPARTQPVVHEVPEGEAAPAGPLELTELAPLTVEAGPEPARAAVAAREWDVEWLPAGQLGKTVGVESGMREPHARESVLMEWPAAGPVAAVRGTADVERSPYGASFESPNPRMGAGLGLHFEARAAVAESSMEARTVANLPDDFEPAECGLVELGAMRVRADRIAHRECTAALAEAECQPQAPRTGVAVALASMRHADALSDVSPEARPAAPPAYEFREKALRPKRRLIGPRVKRREVRLGAFPEAGLAVMDSAAPLSGERICRTGAEAPIELLQAEPRIPAVRAAARQMGLALASMAEMTGQSPQALRGSEQALLPAAPDWPAAASLIPVAGLSVEELMICKPEAAAVADPETQAPPLCDRLLPVFASRGLDCRREKQDAVKHAEGPDWALALSRPPASRPSLLTVDHADGSGSRLALVAANTKRPWHSIQLPSFHFASWRMAPADFKWIMVALPMILLIALYSFLPPRTKNSVETAAGTPSQPTVLSQRFEAIRTAIMERAAIKLADDFRSGLGAWQGPSGWAQTWKYNSANYAVPGQLALYRPSLGLRDYVFSFLGQVDKRSVNWVVRARDESNYLAMRIVMTRSGPLPAASLVRYPVVRGKMGRQTVLPLPMTFRDGTMQQVEVSVAGDTITTRVMGQIVDSFTERELESGGVGFFSPKGDRALLRWISVTHQYDYIGRLCALLAPHSVMSREARRME